ncbi:MAG TPA: glycerate kinase, partial [Microbacterium sp.]|nr:glycerate kinase [Microbacterium sp.]
GEGTLDAFLAAIPGTTLRPMRATGADGERHDSAWVLVPPEGSWGGATAVIEL